MKKSLTSFVAGLLVAGLFAFSSVHNPDPADKGLGRVEKRSGKYVFLECEPVAEYTVAFEVKASKGGAWQLSDYAESALKRAQKTSEKDNKPFDAVLIKSGQDADIAIKFK